MDINSLAFSLKYNKQLPTQVEKYRHTYDVVMDWLGFLYIKSDDLSYVYQFFTHPGGFILNEGIAK